MKNITTEKDIAQRLRDRIKEWGVAIDSTNTKRGKSSWSHQFRKRDSEDECDCLKRIFDITIPDWQNKFDEAVSGSGNERNRILTLHSSALLALLTWSHISVENPFVFDGEEYTSRWFEVKNKVFAGPSCIDIVLKSKTGNLLFLESKFTEYLHPQSPKIRDYYLSFYHNLLPQLPDIPLQYKFPHIWSEGKKPVTGLTLAQTKKCVIEPYLEGIKQSYSHLIGIMQGPYGKPCECYDGIGDDTKLRYGTILYEFPGNQFDSYRDLYSKTIGKTSTDMLVSSLHGHTTPYADRLIIIPDIITYQDVFKSIQLPERIKKFYHL